MKITAGLGSVDDYIRYVNAGADELFCGYVPFSWAEKYGTVMALNRREVLSYNVQIGSFSELEILAEMILVYHKPVHLTFNSLYYLPEQYAEIAEIIQNCCRIGFESFIIADPALLIYLREHGITCEVHLSGDLGTVNTAMADAFTELSPKRIIFQRKNTIAEMREVIRHIRKGDTPQTITEFEAFALNEMCQFSGAFCNSLHCDEMGYLCRVPYWRKPIKIGPPDQLLICLATEKRSEPPVSQAVPAEELLSEEEDAYDEDGYLCGASGCGLCALKQLSDAGITHLKLVGRGNYADFMERDIRNLRRALDILETSQSDAEYQKKMKTALSPNGCGHLCYYRKNTD